MPKLISVLTIAVYLSACQSTINGVDTSVQPAQGESSFCGRNLGLCLVGGALVVGGIAAAASSGYSKKNYTTTGGTTSTGGTTMTGGTYP